MISPYARQNYVSHALTDQTSILRFIEDNWLRGQRVSEISFDNFAGSLADMFDFSRPVMRRLLAGPGHRPARARRAAAALSVRRACAIFGERKTASLAMLGA